MKAALAIVLLLAGCSTFEPPAEEFWYRIYKIDHMTGQALGRVYTCHSDVKKDVTCWEEQ